MAVLRRHPDAEDAVEVIPGNRRIVDHVLTYVDASGESVARDDADRCAARRRREADRELNRRFSLVL
jgi:hypothetical protein